MPKGPYCPTLGYPSIAYVVQTFVQPSSFPLSHLPPLASPVQTKVDQSIDASTRLLRQEQTQKWTHTRRLIDDLSKQHRDLHRKIDDMTKVMHEIGTRDMMR